MRFERKEILKPHIEFNTAKRNNARNDFEKDIYSSYHIMLVLEKPWKVRENI